MKCNLLEKKGSGNLGNKSEGSSCKKKGSGNLGNKLTPVGLLEIFREKQRSMRV
jgi:hypothetical protein